MKFDFFNLLYSKTVKVNPEKHYVMISNAKYHLPEKDWQHNTTGSVMAGGTQAWMLPAAYVHGKSDWNEIESDLSKPGLFYAGSSAWEKMYLGYSVNFSGMAGQTDFKTTEMTIKNFSIVSEDPVTKSNLKEFNGTSMAAPHVTGIASWIIAMNPSTKPEEVKAKIIASCEPASSMTKKAVCGGRVSLLSAVK